MIMGKKIVAVDDSTLVLRMLNKVFDKKHDLHAFSDAKRALDFLEKKTPDLLILDIDMPGVNGFDMLQMVKKMEHLKDMPVIFLTSNNDKSHVVKAVSSGANDYMIKPIDEEILLNKVEGLLSGTV